LDQSGVNLGSDRGYRAQPYQATRDKIFLSRRSEPAVWTQRRKAWEVTRLVMRSRMRWKLELRSFVATAPCAAASAHRVNAAAVRLSLNRSSALV